MHPDGFKGLTMSAKVGRIYFHFNVEGQPGRDNKGLVRLKDSPFFLIRKQHFQRAADHGHGFFFTGTELVIARGHNAHRGGQGFRLESHGFHPAIEIFVYVEHDYLLPLNSSGWFRRNVVGDPVDALDLVDNAV